MPAARPEQGRTGHRQANRELMRAQAGDANPLRRFRARGVEPSAQADAGRRCAARGRVAVVRDPAIHVGAWRAGQARTDDRDQHAAPAAPAAASPASEAGGQAAADPDALAEPDADAESLAHTAGTGADADRRPRRRPGPTPSALAPARAAGSALRPAAAPASAPSAAPAPRPRAGSVTDFMAAT